MGNLAPFFCRSMFLLQASDEKKAPENSARGQSAGDCAMEQEVAKVNIMLEVLL
jgi:hypothetical protein